ncbi:MAG: M1 family peptidase, partial [Chloroflexi bacterium]
SSNGHTFVWEHNFPMATYLSTIAVGDYERIDDVSPNGIPIRHYIFTEHAEDFARATSITGEAIDWMSDLFGPYPFETIGFVTADAPGVSLETQTTIVLSTSMIGQTTVVHELAHMWFGNWVSLNSWQEMWRNEGFATYVTMMWDHRDDPEGLELEIEAIKSAVADNEPNYPLGSPPKQYLFGFNTYFEGAVMVHELRRTVGDDAFFSGLQAYFEQYGGGTASDAEFQAVMETASGISLDAFFAVWLN